VYTHVLSGLAADMNICMACGSPAQAWCLPLSLRTAEKQSDGVQIGIRRESGIPREHIYPYDSVQVHNCVICKATMFMPHLVADQLYCDLFITIAVDAGPLYNTPSPNLVTSASI
jgi:hypothetical protein